MHQYIPLSIKAELKKITALRSAVGRWRGKRQEKSYLSLCAEATARMPEGLGPDSGRTMAHEMVIKKWTPPQTPKKETQDVHIFLLDRPSFGGVWMQEELNRNFRLSSLSLTRYAECLESGSRDPLGDAMGVDPDDRSNAPFRGIVAEGGRDRMQADIVKAVRGAHEQAPVDFCFAYGTPREFDRGTLEAIRAMGIPVGLWYLDEKHGFAVNQEPLIGAYDLHLTNSYEPIRWYMARGQASYYFPEAADPDVFVPRDCERDIPVSFVGQAYGERLKFIRTLQKAGVPIECFGKGWPNGFAEDMEEIACRSKINLGFGYTGSSNKLTCLKGRDFEIPATGAVYMTTFDPELAHMFCVGKEVLCYQSPFDCIEQIKMLLEQPELINQIGAAARTRVLTEHTWTARFSELLRWMGVLE